MTPTELIAKLTQYNDIETATAIWAEANTMAKECAAIKKMCQSLVEQHLIKTGEAKGKTQTCSYGWTNPKPKRQLNEKEWQTAMLENEHIREIVSTFEWQEMRLNRAKEPFYEEVVPEARVYIK